MSLTVDESRDESQVDDLVRLRERYQAAGIRADSAKIFADGVIESGTAALLEPYIDVPHRGELNFPPEVLDRIVTRLDKEGFQVHVHAIGDRAIRVSLDAFEKARSVNGPRDSRHHVAHIELFHPDDIPRFQKLGVVANFQPLWAYADTYITDLTEPQLGPERSRWLYPIGSLAKSGAILAAGSDWSVSSMNPLDGIQVALTRTDIDAPEGPPWIPEERVDLDTILAAYTRGGAYLQHEEALTGSLEVGKRGDLVVLEKNLFEIPETEIHRVRVLLTLLDGKEVFRDPSFPRTIDRDAILRTMRIRILLLAAGLFLAGCADEPDSPTPTDSALPYAFFDLSGHILGPNDDESDIDITLKETGGVDYHINFVRLTCNNRTSQEWGASDFAAELGSNRVAGGTTLVFRRHYRCPGSARPQEILADLTDANGHPHRVTAAPHHPAWPGG